MIVLDQFEEFFIRLSPQFREAFIAELGALYDARDVPVKVVLSLREDWLAAISEIEERIPEVFRTRMRLLPLSREQARQAITAPVERLGVSYERALVERLISDLAGEPSVASDARPSQPVVMPPQLQLVCSALYDGLGTDEGLITLAMYEQLGGARGVLQKYLDDELARLESDERALALGALEELVTSQRTKAVKAGDELALALRVEASDLEPVLEKLVRARLLRPVERAAAERAYELAHEYLIAEIALGPEAVARKEAEELLRQGIDNWQRFEALPSAEAFGRIDAQRDRLRLNADAQELMLRSALRHGLSMGHWLGRVKDVELALALTQETLLAPQGEPARRSLNAAAGDVEPERLGALVDRLAASWRQARGVERACASDALWALRPYLPPRLRLQLALNRSLRSIWRPLYSIIRRSLHLARRAALPLAAAFLIQRGLRLWTPKPEIDWVAIPAGEFLMGSDPAVDPDAYDGEMPQHTVYLDAYRISRFEIINAQYAQCVRAMACGKLWELGDYSDPNYTNHPAVDVSWYNARRFCTWVRGRLPTEAEWEYAARGLDGRVYPWGNEAPTCERAQFAECEGHTVPVDSLSDGASWCGVQGMADNVWEWIADWYDEYPSTPQTNPTGPEMGNYKVLRGGGWYTGQTIIRTATRGNGYPAGRVTDVGFRCVAAPGE